MSTSLSLPQPRDAPPPAPGAGRQPIGAASWLLTAGAVVAVAAGIVVASGMRPGYDAYGWLVWGHQGLHWNLNLDGAPSWKPLTFLFTLPYALAGRAQMWLWLITAIAAALGGCVFAARIAHRLTGPSPGRRYPPLVAAAFAGICVLGIATYAQLALIANADPLIMTLCLAAIDCHLAGRRRLAFVMLVLAALGRPEAWVFAGLYAIWAWRAVPGMRVLTVLGVALVPAFWFTIPALASHSWFIAGDLALNQHTIIHGDKFLGVIQRFAALTDAPILLAALLGVALAIVRRDGVTLGLAGAAALWIVIEIALAYHGWSAVPRYLIEPAAVTIAIAGGTVGRLLAGSRAAPLLRWTGPFLVLVVVAAVVPTARSRVHDARHQYHVARDHAKQVNRLHDVIVRIGGPTMIKACGQPVSLVGFQSTVAWEVGVNVGNVGFRPGRSIRHRQTIVLFKPHRLGWQVRPYNVAQTAPARCRALRTDSAMG